MKQPLLQKNINDTIQINGIRIILFYYFITDNMHFCQIQKHFEPAV